MFKVNLPVVKALKKGGKLILQGASSSTALDAHSEKMSEECLQDMVNQVNMMMLPFRSEHSWKWDDEMGTLKRGWYEKNLMMVEIELDSEFSSKATDLWNRVKSGKSAIGMSIGGMIVDAHFEYDDEREMDVLVYDRIALKEISATSMPANPDTFLDAMSKSLDIPKFKESHVLTYSDTGMQYMQDYITRNEKASEDFIHTLGYSSEMDIPDSAFVFVKSVGDQKGRYLIIRNSKGEVDSRAWINAWRTHVNVDAEHVDQVREALLKTKPTNISIDTSKENNSETSLSEVSKKAHQLSFKMDFDIEDSDVVLNVFNDRTEEIVGSVNLTKKISENISENLKEKLMPKHIVKQQDGDEGTVPTPGEEGATVEAAPPAPAPVEAPVVEAPKEGEVSSEEAPAPVAPPVETPAPVEAPKEGGQEAPVATPAPEQPTPEAPATPAESTTEKSYVTQDEFTTLIETIAEITKAIVELKASTATTMTTVKSISEGLIGEVVRINESVNARKSIASSSVFTTVEKADPATTPTGEALKGGSKTPDEQIADLIKGGATFQEAYKKVKHG